MLFWFAVGIIIAYFMTRSDKRKRDRYNRRIQKKESERLNKSFGRYISTCPKCERVAIMRCGNCDNRFFEKMSSKYNTLTCYNCNSNISIEYCECGCEIYSEFFEKINHHQIQKLVDYQFKDKKLHNLLTSILSYHKPRLSLGEFERILSALFTNPKDIKSIDFSSCETKFLKKSCKVKIVNSLVLNLLKKI